jgi:hypothetical protein
LYFIFIQFSRPYTPQRERPARYRDAASATSKKKTGVKGSNAQVPYHTYFATGGTIIAHHKILAKGGISWGILPSSLYLSSSNSLGPYLFPKLAPLDPNNTCASKC